MLNDDRCRLRCDLSNLGASERKSAPAAVEAVVGHPKPIMSESLFVFGNAGWKRALQGTSPSILSQMRCKC